MKNYRAAGGLLFFSYGPFLAFWDFSCLSWYTNDKLRMENVDWKQEKRREDYDTASTKSPTSAWWR